LSIDKLLLKLNDANEIAYNHPMNAIYFDESSVEFKIERLSLRASFHFVDKYISILIKLNKI